MSVRGGSAERLPAFVDGVRQKQELPRCGDPGNLVRLALVLQSAVDGADAWVEARSRQSRLVEILPHLGAMVKTCDHVGASVVGSYPLMSEPKV
mgnify:CR=1 FL=1